MSQLSRPSPVYRFLGIVSYPVVHALFRLETHGLDCGPYEHCFQEWWECAVCGDQFTERELARMSEE